MKDHEIRTYTIEDRYINEPVIIKSGKEKRRERRAKQRKRNH